MPASDLPTQGWLATNDIDLLRDGHFADPPYVNLVELLRGLDSTGPAAGLLARDAFAEVHIIARRAPFVVMAGIPRATEMLSRCMDWRSAGHAGAPKVEAWAVPDGTMVVGDGIPAHASSVMVIRAPYTAIAHLKTPLLGTLARASRIATNTYRALTAANGKPVYTFAARYDLHEAQAIDGYAYGVAVRSFNRDNATTLSNAVSTRANSTYTHAQTVGTISHEAVACFDGDIAALMLHFAETMPIDRLRVALVDFRNDCMTDAERVMRALYGKAASAREIGDHELEQRYRLDGVRIDTSLELADAFHRDRGEGGMTGVTPELVAAIRQMMNRAWERWSLPPMLHAHAADWCRNVQIIVSGGFDEARIRRFEEALAPVDAYAVGSALLSSCRADSSTTDFSAGVLRIRTSAGWRDVGKVGRARNWNTQLTSLDLQTSEETRS
jgi:nicotinate phosphoribosyltransferase